jgi:hypothetical protein
MRPFLCPVIPDNFHLLQRITLEERYRLIADRGYSNNRTIRQLWRLDDDHRRAIGQRLSMTSLVDQLRPGLVGAKLKKVPVLEVLLSCSARVCSQFCHFGLSDGHVELEVLGRHGTLELVILRMRLELSCFFSRATKEVRVFRL